MDEKDFKKSTDDVQNKFRMMIKIIKLIKKPIIKNLNPSYLLSETIASTVAKAVIKNKKKGIESIECKFSFKNVSL